MGIFVELTKYDRNRFDDIDKKIQVNAALIAVIEETGPSTSVILQNVLEPMHVKESPDEIIGLVKAQTGHG